MTFRARLLAFAALLALALAALFPLRLALPAEGPLGARAARGTVWNGRLEDARAGALPLGDLRVGLRPQWLLAGRVRLLLSTPGRPPALRIAIDRGGGRGEVAADGRLPIAGALGALPIVDLQFAAARAGFAGGRCSSATGQVAATLTGEFGGIALPPEVRGPVRCSGEAVVMPMTDAGGQAGLTLRVTPAGAWSAEVRLPAPTPEVADALRSRGFRERRGVWRLTVMGRV